jgi:hypothetical protein
VGQRQERDENVGTLHLVVAHLHEDGAHRGHHVLVGQHDAFGVTGGTAGVANGAEI